MKKLIVLTLFIFMLVFTTAQLSNIGTFRQGDEVRIVQVCSDATYINITSISYPNSSQAVSNVAMIQDGGEFYYLFDDTSTLGRYDVRGIANGCEKTFATYFQITPTGTDEISIGFVVILMLASLIFGYFAWMFNRDMFLHILFIFGSMIVLLYGINQLHMPMLFFTAVVIILLAFVYYIINYIRDTMSVFRKNRGWE